MTLDHATTQFLAQMAASGAKPMHQMTPADVRASGEGLIALNGPGPRMYDVVDDSIDTDDGACVPVRILKPTSHPRGILIYLHGGGWVTGTLDEFDALGRTLAAESGAAVVLVGYRLAPEHPFPVPLNDALRATRWVAEHRQQIASDPAAPITVAGDSAGGNLAAVVAQRSASDATLPIALQILIYPVVNCDLDTESYLDPENQLALDRSAMSWSFDHYVPDTADRINPDVSPALAPDLSDVPPAVILTAEHDVLRTEGEAYVAALADAGVAVEHQHFPGQMHGFFNIMGLGDQRKAVDFVAAKVRLASGARS